MERVLIGGSFRLNRPGKSVHIKLSAIQNAIYSQPFGYQNNSHERTFICIDNDI